MQVVPRSGIAGVSFRFCLSQEMRGTEDFVMRKIYIVAAIFLMASMVLAACGGNTADQTSTTDSSAPHDYYEPEGPTIHFNRVGGTVNVSLSHYVGESPTEPVEVVMTGEADSEAEGLVVSLSWKQVETYKPELLKDFDKLCTYRWTAVIDGKKAITQHIEKFDGACWVEFVFTEQ